MEKKNIYIAQWDIDMRIAYFKDWIYKFKYNHKNIIRIFESRGKWIMQDNIEKGYDVDPKEEQNKKLYFLITQAM